MNFPATHLLFPIPVKVNHKIEHIVSKYFHHFKNHSKPDGTKTTVIELETNCKVLTVKF